MKRDPHLTFAHGGKADFKGKNNSIYNMLSASNISVSARFVHDDFILPRRLVHGSCITAAYITMQSWCPWCPSQFNTRASRNITVEFNRTTEIAMLREKGKPTKKLRYGTDEVRIGNIHVKMALHPAQLQITDGRWSVVVIARDYPNAPGNPGKRLLHVYLDPMTGYDVDKDMNAPHGLIGQSYDGDGLAVSGNTDAYTGTEVTTLAQAEGAIEGTAEDYRIASPFATTFKYSRFNSRKAARRDVLTLKGRKHPESSSKGGAVSDQMEPSLSTQPQVAS